MKNVSIKFVFGLLSATATVLVFLNTYEVVYNKDVVGATSVAPMVAQNAIEEVTSNFDTKQGVSQQEFQQPINNVESIQIPSLHYKIQIEDARKINKVWYTRPSFGNMIGLNKDSRQTVVDHLVYMKKSWRTIPDGAKITKGLAVNLLHDGGGVANYEVISVNRFNISQVPIIEKSEKRQIIIILEDTNTDSYYAYSLEALN